MEILTKTYEALSKDELYQILQLRSEVFVLEQNCAYQDIDGKDKKALHIFGKKENEIVAYTRVFKPGDYFKNASIGRVVVRIGERKYGYGKDIMLASIQAVKKEYKKDVIELSAQTYLLNFYNDLGFEKVGEDYLEDGILHIKMIKNK